VALKFITRPNKAMALAAGRVDGWQAAVED